MIGLTSPTHLALLFLIALCLFGAKRLPEIGRSLGTGMKEFKDSVTGNSKHDDDRPELPTTTTAETTTEARERETV